MGYASGTLLVIVVVSLVLATLITGEDKAPSSSSLVIESHCPDKCGNVSIPYPFGLKDGCYHKETNSTNFPYHKIKCNYSATPPMPIFGINLELLSISLEGELRVNNDISYDCYDNESQPAVDGYNKNSIRTGRFTVSGTQNVLVGIGCDTNVWFVGFRKGKLYDTGCTTVCYDLEDVAADGDCNGIGCCKSSFPEGVTNINTSISSFWNHRNASFNPCSAAFPIAKDAFKFHKGSLTKKLDYYKHFKQSRPVVFNWAVGTENCSVAKASDDYLCKDNTFCEDSSNQVGYRCKCKHGFEGNPYLPQGCTDINECINSNDCEKPEYCVNEFGGYHCKCPKGYKGEGTKAHPCYSDKNTWLIPVLATAVCSGSIILLLFGWWLNSLIKTRKLRMQRATFFAKNGGMLLRQHISSEEESVERVKIFKIDELEKATDYFNEDRILGKGGHGTVYKGMLSGGKIVAVKKSNKVEENQQQQFINEVFVLSQLNHRNIVRLFGCCLETEVPLLVYEFILNGTLSHHIHDRSEDRFPLTWKMRLQIASDTAGALAYLHSSTSTSIFHRDIKSSNILLDDKYKAKLSDFGTSRSVPSDQTHVFTNVVGTFGYLDPEYFQSHQFTEKSDVYSFGVVLVELLSGQKAIRADPKEERSLISWFLSQMENSYVHDIVDSEVLQENMNDEFLTIANLAKRCLSLDGRSRPAMKEVLLEIEAVLSHHMPHTSHPNEPNSKQLIAVGASSSTHSSTFELETRVLDSAELSLLYNPR